VSGPAARFNHSCAPNVYQSFDEHGCITLDTVRGVTQGEELTIPYINTKQPRDKRRGLALFTFHIPDSTFHFSRFTVLLS